MNVQKQKRRIRKLHWHLTEALHYAEALQDLKTHNGSGDVWNFRDYFTSGDIEKIHFWSKSSEAAFRDLELVERDGREESA